MLLDISDGGIGMHGGGARGGGEERTSLALGDAKKISLCWEIPTPFSRCTAAL
jgi:hypothetical protein